VIQKKISAPESQLDHNKAEVDGAIRCFRSSPLSDEGIKLKSYSVPEKNVQLDGSMVLNRTEAACKSRKGSLEMNSTKFVADPAILYECKKDKEADSGISSSVSRLPTKMVGQKEIKQQLALRLKEDDVLLKSLKHKVQVSRANLSEPLKVEITPPQTPVRSNIKTEDELKESTQVLISESSELQKLTKSHSTENVVQAKLP